MKTSLRSLQAALLSSTSKTGRSNARLAIALAVGALLFGRFAVATEPRTAEARFVSNRFTTAIMPPVPEAAALGDRLKPMSEVALPAPLPARLPQPDFAERRFGDEELEYQPPGAGRAWPMIVSSWEAPALCHRPLYFEDENLERYGHSFGIFQPAVSAGHFASRAVALPYLMGAFPSHDCVYPLGKGRPGSYMPYYLYRPPVSARGAVYQAGAVAGVSWFVP